MQDNNTEGGTVVLLKLQRCIYTLCLITLHRGYMRHSPIANVNHKFRRLESFKMLGSKYYPTGRYALDAAYSLGSCYAYLQLCLPAASAAQLSDIRRLVDACARP